MGCAVRLHVWVCFVAAGMVFGVSARSALSQSRLRLRVGRSASDRVREVKVGEDRSDSPRVGRRLRPESYRVTDQRVVDSLYLRREKTELARESRMIGAEDDGYSGRTSRGVSSEQSLRVDVEAYKRRKNQIRLLF